MTAPTAIKWHGGKAYLADRIVGLMPAHTHYVEVFAGGLSVLLAKDPEGVSEVVNDLDDTLTNFWKVLQTPEHFSQFIRRIEATPFSQVEFAAATEPTDDPVISAVRFFIRCRQSRQGLQKDFATLSRNRIRRGRNEQVSAWLSAVQQLPEVAARLRRVVILNDDALRVIRQQGGPNTLFYCDPPYLHTTRTTTGQYRYEMTAEQHSQLLNVLRSVQGKVLLSGYPSNLYDSTLHDWHTVDFLIDNKASGVSNKPQMTERMWMNY